MRKHLLLALSLLGLFDALYLLWVYTSPSRPIVCLGGGCDAVRASSYAHLFGVPLPAFGVANYLVLALLILAADLVSAPLARSIRAVLAAISGGGFLYSIYLTSLEKWVIHAWCTWCVISAITVTCIFLLSLAELRRPPAPAEPPAALANVRRNYVLCVVALLVGVPAFLVLSRHGDMLLAKQVSSKALAEHLVRPDNHMAGNLNAPLTVVEFGDFECPGCALSEQAAQQVRAKYGDRLRFVFREFPLRKMHPQAEKAAEAAECAADQGKFWEAVEKLYDGQTDLSVAALKHYAGELGLDQGRFNQCLDTSETASRIKQDVADGHALGVEGTPTFFIGSTMEFRPLDFATFSQLVEEALTGLGSSSPSATPPAQASRPSAATPAGAKAPSAGSESLFSPNPAGFLAGPQTSIGACSEAEAAKKQPAMIGTAEARQLFEAAPKPLFVDVRPATDYARGRIPGALNMPAENFAQGLDRLPKDRTIVLYESGQAAGDICAVSRAAGRALLDRGFSFSRVKVYQDGLAAWESAGQPIQK